ncbi:MAG: alpha/beta hydrolase [Verrucomicrobiales bacterium]|jgi:acetyl esterase/lipase|nr:alpha/beta hydrolase [bacterium]MDF2377203.1 alpha/beta hydrolase [Verrucomicrobiales bacterium]
MQRSIKLLGEREKQLLESAQPLKYREVREGADLVIHFYFPKDLKEKDPGPVFLFYNSGAWDRGSVIQFAPHALYYVERGAVCGLVEYRNQASHPGVNPVDAARDSQLSIQFVRHHAESLHVDPDKLVVFGGGAGANIAGCAAMKAHIPTEESSYNLSKRRPDGAVLFSTIIDIQKGSYGAEAFPDGESARRMSLSRYISGGVPPMMMIHGTADRLVPFREAREFANKMERKRSPFTLIEFEGRDQNFFNMNTDPVSYEAALYNVDAFLDEHGFLEKRDDDESRLISWRESDF